MPTSHSSSQHALPPRPSTSIKGFIAMALLLLTWGLLMGLSFPRANLHVLAHLAPAPLALLAIRGQSLKRTLGMIFLGAWVWWAVMLSWLVSVTGPGWIVLAAYLALYQVLFSGILRLIHRRFALPLVFTLPMVWVAVEYLRGTWAIGGFPWFGLGHSQPTLIIQIADTLGAYGVSGWVAMTSGMVLDVLTRPMFRRSISGRRVRGIPLLVSLPLWFLVLTGVLAYGSFRIYQTGSLDRATRGPEGATTNHLRVAVVQTNVPQDNKNHATDEQDLIDFEAMVNLTRQAAAQGPSLIAWPETMTPRPINDESVRWFDRYGVDYGQYRRRIEELVEAIQIPIVVGVSTRLNWRELPDGRAQPQTRYNSAYFIEPGVSIGERYDKIHRVPFGEYIPGTEGMSWLKALLSKLTPPEGRALLENPLDAGGVYATFNLNVKQEAWSIATPICFEDVVSDVPRKMVWNPAAPSVDNKIDGGGEPRKRTDVLVNLTNDAWYPGAPEGPQHEQIARFRCVENRVPMARAVNTGVSGFIDSVGRVIGRVNVDGRSQLVAGVQIAELFKDPRVTIFSRVGDAFAALCLTVTGAMSLTGFFITVRK